MIAVLGFAALFCSRPAAAWDNHAEITRAALQAYEGWGQAQYEPLESALPSLSVGAASAPATTDDLVKQLAINGKKITWDWGREAATLLDVLAYSVVEPDSGMDQDLNISPDQKYMGGFTGPSSQAIRHMYYPPWAAFAPCATFHFPLHEMGLAPGRAEVFFGLARQAMASGHVFWAHRFLGMGMHYVQDMGQPYHASQFASPRLLPVRRLWHSWDDFVAEATRVVANFHLAFEQFVKREMAKPDSDLVIAFRVPSGDEELKVKLEQNPSLPISEGVKSMARSSAKLAPVVAAAEKKALGAVLSAPGLDLISGWTDPATGLPKVNLAVLDTMPELREPRERLREAALRALSNTGVATRWYYDRFRAR